LWKTTVFLWKGLNFPVETLGNQWGKVEIEHPAVITVTTGCHLTDLQEKYPDYSKQVRQ
jgi:hypothetical protein